MLRTPWGTLAPRLRLASRHGGKGQWIAIQETGVLLPVPLPWARILHAHSNLWICFLICGTRVLEDCKQTFSGSQTPVGRIRGSRGKTRGSRNLLLYLLLFIHSSSTCIHGISGFCIIFHGKNRPYCQTRQNEQANKQIWNKNPGPCNPQYLIIFNTKMYSLKSNKCSPLSSFCSYQTPFRQIFFLPPNKCSDYPGTMWK